MKRLSPKTAIVAGRLILQSVPDRMIVEADMTFMNGIEFFAPLKADGRTRDIPVVFLGSNADFDDLARGLGAIAFLTNRSMPTARSKSSPSAFGQRPRNEPPILVHRVSGRSSL